MSHHDTSESNNGHPNYLKQSETTVVLSGVKSHFTLFEFRISQVALILQEPLVSCSSFLQYHVNMSLSSMSSRQDAVQPAETQGLAATPHIYASYQNTISWLINSAWYHHIVADSAPSPQSLNVHANVVVVHRGLPWGPLFHAASSPDGGGPLWGGPQIQ